jgi:UDP-N-acetylmuramoyl-L-alanyl-D-glutamate--2,6-diaminopimelate ligase
MKAPGMSLRQLLAPWVEAPETVVSDLTLDSRACVPGSLFIALAGGRGHGLDYADAAVTGGAVAMAWEPTGEVDPAAVRRCRERGVVSVAVPRLGERASAIADRFFDAPSKALSVIGVTGTDGKTSVSQFVAAALDEPGRRCGVIGTLGCGFPGALEPGTHTTPDAVTLQRRLALLRARGALAAAIEVSSHALDQHRAAAVDIDVAVLTQLGRDHLDYHGSVEAYAAAKRRLFEYAGVGARVLNRDDGFGRDLIDRHADTAITYSPSGAAADIRLTGFRPEATGMRLVLDVRGTEATLSLPLFGRFNAANAMAALGALLGLGQSPAEALDRIARLKPVAGRMERFVAPAKPTVVVDYAHTPGALAAALDAARQHCGGRLWVVFGCGGDRDPGKRPLMGKAACDGADRVVITSDNPRSESPEAIIADIRRGCDGADVHAEPDREAAIAWALERAADDDLILIAGKGHETTQVIGAEVRPFSDRETVRSLLGGGAA